MAASRIAAAAAVKPITSGRKHAAWLIAAMAVQSVWGLYSVCTRYLQTQGPTHIPTLQLSAVISAICWPGTFIICYLPSCMGAIHTYLQAQKQSKQLKQQEAAADAIVQADAADQASIAIRNSSSTGTSAASSRAEVAAAMASGPNGSSQECHKPGGKQLSMLWQWAKVQCLALAVGSLICFAALGLVYASVFVPAYLVQLIMVLIPLFTAVANKLVLQQPTPYLLWPMLAVGIVGSVLVIVGQWLEHSTKLCPTSSVSHLSATTCLLIGMGISIASAVLFSMYFVALQATRRIVTTQQQVMGSRNIAILVLVPLALAVEGTHWSWLWHLGPGDWAVLLFAAIVAYMFATIGLQWCTRALGGAVVAQFNSMRLVAAIAGSAVLLHEVPKNPVLWVGFVIVIVSMSLWLYLQARQNKQQQQQEREEKVAASAV